MRPFRYVTLGLSLFCVWLLLSGHYQPLTLGFGVASSVLVAYTAWRMDREDKFAFRVSIPWRLPGYLFWLLKEIFKSNVKVAKIILDPELPISPIMVPFKAAQQSDYFRMIYANSITLTPGTITTGTDGEVLRIHALTWHDVDGREEDEMDIRIAELEGRA